MSVSQVATRATDAQVGFLNDLLAKREVPAAVRAQYESEVLTKASASGWINLLKTYSYKARLNGAADVDVEVTQNVAEGIYTVVDANGDYTTLRLQRGAWCQGKLVLSYLCGSDNELSYRAFAFVYANVVRPFRAFKENTRLLGAAKVLFTTDLVAAREAFLDKAESYAMASGQCLACLRTLTVPASLSRGLGPVCAARLGVV